MFFKNRTPRKKKTTHTNDTTKTEKELSDKNKEAFKVGSSIAKLITSSGIPKKNQGRSISLTDEFIMVELDLY
jgi:hypothetical protein